MKGHGAADWSKRPLPAEWLNYAALDVEVLLELRAAVAAELEAQGKTRWAAEEFEHLRTYVAAPDPAGPWRKTSGIHKVKNPRTLAAVRELWTTRDHHRAAPRHRARPHPARRRHHQRRDGRPDTVDELVALPVFGGSRQRRSASVWVDALARARSTKDLPKASEPSPGRRPRCAGAGASPRRPNASRPSARGLAELSQRVSVPTENLLTPELVRRLVWDWQPVSDAAAVVDAFLAEAGARPWQRELTVPVISTALTAERQAPAEPQNDLST